MDGSNYMTTPIVMLEDPVDVTPGMVLRLERMAVLIMEMHSRVWY